MATIFFSYSHKDEALRNELEMHLSMLKHEGLIEAWHDRRIPAGDELDEAIFRNLESADVILLLVSSDFIGSWYCYSKEMQRAMERHDAGEARVIPVILRHCDWGNAPFGRLLAAPRDGKPVASWADRDEAMTDVARQVRQALKSTPSKPRARDAAVALPAVPRVPLHSAGGADGGFRSSNLRLKQEFTDKDRDDFVRSAFDFICRYFENSLDAVCDRNADVTGSYDRIDSQRMTAMLYRHGKAIAECAVRLDSLGRSGGIAFSYQASASSGSYNEMLMPEAGEQSMHFKTMMSSWGGGQGKHMSEEGAAEYLWGMFVARAQS